MTPTKERMAALRAKQAAARRGKPMDGHYACYNCRRFRAFCPRFPPRCPLCGAKLSAIAPAKRPHSV